MIDLYMVTMGKHGNILGSKKINMLLIVYQYTSVWITNRKCYQIGLSEANDLKLLSQVLFAFGMQVGEMYVYKNKSNYKNNE